MSAAEQFQQQRLTVHFVHRFVDNELLAGSGDPRQVFVTAFALTGAAGFTMALLLTLRYFYRINELAEPIRQAALASDRQLLILLTATLTGLFTVLAWDALLPDAKDAQILGSLPVLPGVILRAKLTAALIYFTVLQAAFQIFLLALPIVSNTGGFGGLFYQISLQSLILWSVALFVFFGAMAVQGLLVLLLPYRLFLPFSSALQLLWLMASLSVTFFMPPLETVAGRGAHWAGWIPAAWFLDAWQNWAGRPAVYGRFPAIVPIAATVLLAVVAAGTFTIGFRTVLRRVVQGGSSRRTGPGLVARCCASLCRRLLLHEPREEAAFLFTGRTLSRHRNTRLMLTVYGGLALCWTLFSLSEAMRPGAQVLQRPSGLLLSIPLDFSFLLLLGMRVMFAMPVELRANWLFRVLDRDGEQFYLRGVRKLMYVGGCLPLALALAPGYLFLWGPEVTFRHTLLVLLAGWVITERLMRDFHKIPFTCSWVPGKANLKVTLGAWVLLFTTLSWMAGAIEAQAVQTSGGTLRLAAILGLIIAWQIWRRRRDQAPRLVFEESNHAGLELLQLER